MDEDGDGFGGEGKLRKRVAFVGTVSIDEKGELVTVEGVVVEDEGAWGTSWWNWVNFGETWVARD